jgi:hypothetical protein
MTGEGDGLFDGVGRPSTSTSECLTFDLEIFGDDRNTIATADMNRGASANKSACSRARDLYCMLLWPLGTMNVADRIADIQNLPEVAAWLK